MVNYFIYAKDFSGSTLGCNHYHTNGLKTLEEFKNNVDKIVKDLLIAGQPSTESKIIYLHWGDMCYEVSEKKAIDSYKRKEGEMDTHPATIIEWIKENCNFCEENKIKLLYIITDGYIHTDSVQNCFELNENMHYETVVFHAFNKYTQNIDLSVASSFFKSRCIVYCNYELFDNINISEEFDYDKINIANFYEEYEQMKSYIRLKFIKNIKSDAAALREIDKLKTLRDRLFAQLELKTTKTKINLNTKEKSIFMSEFVNTNWYNNLRRETKAEIEKTISTLINYIISDNKSFSFDALKFTRKFDYPVEEESIVDIDFAAEEEIEFPDIILDDNTGIPVIILTESNLLNKIIFHKTQTSAEVASLAVASFNKFKSTMECPLFLCNDTDISESIGYFYTLNVYKQLLANNTKTEPRTRKPFHGGLILTDNDRFDKYNDFILSATYFDFKKVYCNKGLFYYVLWKNCENKEWMDKNVVERFKKYVIRRISATVCKIGLSSLPLDPPEITTLPTALWYCVELSSSIFKDDPQNFAHERLRKYYSVAHCMIEILEYFDYDLDIESIEKRRDLLRHVMILKTIPKREEKVYYLLENIFKNMNGFLVSEIEKPFNLNKLNYLELNHKGMLPDNATEGKVHLNGYVHLMHFVSRSEAAKSAAVDICEKTFRPFFTIDQNKSFYTELVKATRKPVIENDDDENRIKITNDTIDSLEFDKTLSLYNLFIKCVEDSQKYPTFPEYLEYISKKKKYHGELVTIFSIYTYVDAQDVYKRYQSIMNKVDVNEFIRVSKNYVTRTKRIKAEEIVKFKDDKEMMKFLNTEESKAGLKKIKISK